MENIKNSHWYQRNVATVLVLAALLLFFGHNCLASDYVALKMYPEHVGVFVADGKQQFVAFGIKADGSRDNITSLVGWESSDESIVIIDGNGLATVVGNVTSGQVRISSSYPKQGKGLAGVNILLLQNNSITLTYTAGAGGMIIGTTPQVVKSGADGTEVVPDPEDHYSFVEWSDGSTANPRTDTGVTADISVIAYFDIDTFTLTYGSNGNGTISGVTPQVVDYNADGTAVTPVPEANYHFVEWGDGSTANPRTDTTVTADISVTAYFDIDTFTLTYESNGNGTISGTTPQVVDHNADGTEVEAVPEANYHFVEWGDGSIANPRTDTAVTADISVTAYFGINTFTLTYGSNGNGTISGTTPQVVDHNANGTAVTPVAATNYHFVDWSDGSTDNPRTDGAVTADISVNANFSNTWTVTYVAGTCDSVTGSNPQTIVNGADGTAVTAETTGVFNSWSDGSTDNPRMDIAVTQDITVTAVCSP